MISYRKLVGVGVVVTLNHLRRSNVAISRKCSTAAGYLCTDLSVTCRGYQVVAHMRSHVQLHCPQTS